MQLNPHRFNAHLQKLGQDMLWRKAYACPCRNRQSGAARTNCPQCSGKGQIWAIAKSASAGVAGQKVQQQWAQFGTYESGDVVLTIPENSPVYELGRYDRVTLLNNTNPFSETVQRGEDRIYRRIKAIERVFWLDSESQVVEGSIPAVDDSGALTWGGGSPPPGSQYSISGTAFTEYFCWGDFTTDRAMHHGARLPRKVVLRLFDLFGR